MPDPRRLAGPCILVLAAGLAGPAAAGTAEVLDALQPHRAVYDMRLGDVEDGANVRAITGRIVTEFSGSSCDGFSTTFRFVSRIDDQSGGSRVTDLRTTSYEAGDGTSFQFVTQNYTDRKLAEETKGVATRDGDKIVVDLVKPANRQVTLDGKALFPTNHIAGVIDAAEQGRSIFEAPLYDGGDKGDKSTLTTAVIGKAVAGDDTAGDDDAAAVAKIGGGPRWPVRLSYFDMDAPQGEQTPMYELSFLIYANGITRRLELDYGEFTIVGKLASVELLERQPCKGD